MDPLTAVGLAGNIIQFIEFGASLVSRTIDLYQSSSGTTAINSELVAIAEDFHGICSRLIQPIDARKERGMPGPELGLLTLARSCIKLKMEFVSVLDDLRVDEAKRRHRKRESIRQAFRSHWKNSDIEQYQKRLDNYRSEVSCRLVEMIR